MTKSNKSKQRARNEKVRKLSSGHKPEWRVPADKKTKKRTDWFN